MKDKELRKLLGVITGHRYDGNIRLSTKEGIGQQVDALENRLCTKASWDALREVEKLLFNFMDTLGYKVEHTTAIPSTTRIVKKGKVKK